FGWQPTSVLRAGERVWKIVSPQGTFALKATAVPEEKIKFVSELLIKANLKGIVPFETLKNSGDRVVVTKDLSWYATRWQKVSDKYQPRQLAAILGRLHRTFQSFIKDEETVHRAFSTQDVMAWKREEIKLSSFYHDIKEEEFPSPVEKVFVHFKPQVEKGLLFAIRAAEKFLKKEKGQFPRYTLCHTRVHLSNVVGQEHEPQLIDFDHAQIDTPVRDIATLLRKTALTQAKAVTDLEEVLAAYEGEYVLLPIEKKLLALFLSYPERPLTVFGKYLKKGVVDDKLEMSSLEKLKNELGHFDLLRSLVLKLWSQNSVTEQEGG
ncbi:MAG: hypothetical protein RLZ12_380, partial [Bacillota bacterium]